MAPTNILRKQSRAARPASALAAADAGAPAATAPRLIRIEAGRIAIRACLLDTPTAERVWRTLPTHSTAERWGASLHFETHVETGRERGARRRVQAGDIAFWCEDDRVIVAWGPTPISKAGEIWLPAPANIFATALDDVAALDAVRPGARVSVARGT